MLGDGSRELQCTVFVEVGAHQQLCRHIEDTLEAAGFAERTLVLPTLRKGKPALDCIYQAAAKLHVAGVELGWNRLTQGGQPIRLPPPGVCDKAHCTTLAMHRWQLALHASLSDGHMVLKSYSYVYKLL